MRAVVSALGVAMVLGACGGSSPQPMGDGGTPGSVHVVFDPGPGGPIDFAAVPFPDDLYGQSGTIEIGQFPGEADLVAGEQGADPQMVATMRESFHDLDGFATTSAVFFRVDGDVDPASLPATPSDSLSPSASVFLLDVGSASPSAFERVPVETHWDAARRMIVVRPWYGHALHEGRTYAAVVTSAVRAVDGTALGPSARFASIRDATTRPTDATDAAAYAEYTPVLASSAVTRANVSGLAVFHVEMVSAELDQAREVVRSADAPALTILRVASGTQLDELLGVPSEDVPGVDVVGGVQHSHIGTLIDGTFPSPSFTASSAFGHGPFRHDASGALVVQGTNTVWFTVALPPGDVSNVPLVVYQHGLGDDRSAIFGIADALCAEGFAVAAIDIPFHGMRAEGTAIDARHAFGSTTGADLYGDLTGTSVYVGFVGVVDGSGPYVAFHPTYPRDMLRQSVVDVMALVNALDRSDWSGVGTMGGPATIGFSDAPIGFVGVSLGGIIGTTFVTGEPRVGAAVLNVTGGELTNLVAFSSAFNETFLPLLLPSIGLDPAALDYAGSPPRFLPEIALYQTLLDRGDSMAFAPILATQNKHVLFQMAYDDEAVPNQATESLARAAGATIVDAMPRYSDLPLGTAPLVSNLVLGSARATRGLTVFQPATHGLLSRRMDEARVMHPPTPPFSTLPTPTPVANPVDAAVTQLVHFFVTFRSGAAEIAD